MSVLRGAWRRQSRQDRRGRRVARGRRGRRRRSLGRRRERRVVAPPKLTGRCSKRCGSESKGTEEIHGD